MNICVFGDSIAKGVVYDENKGRYVFSPDSFTNIISRETGITFKNYARFGCTTEKAKSVIGKHLDELDQYDYVLLEFGGNDCDLDWEAASRCPDDPQEGQVSREAFARNYKDIIRQIKEHGGKPVITTLPPLDPGKFFSWVTKDLDRFNVMRFLKNDRMNIYRWQEEYSELIYEIADSTSVPVLDIRRAFLEASGEDLMCVDGMHPNENGQRLIAGFLEDEWLSLTKKQSGILDWDQLLPFEFSGPLSLSVS